MACPFGGSSLSTSPLEDLLIVPETAEKLPLQIVLSAVSDERVCGYRAKIRPASTSALRTRTTRAMPTARRNALFEIIGLSGCCPLGAGVVLATAAVLVELFSINTIGHTSRWRPQWPVTDFPGQPRRCLQDPVPYRGPPRCESGAGPG